MPHPRSIPAAGMPPPTTFEVGEHKVIVTKVADGRWTVAVDGRHVDASFDTQADAWEAGVREALRVGPPRGQ